MKDFINQFQEFSQLDDAAKLDMITVSRLQHFKKGEVILPVGNVCRHLYFVNQGLVKIFSVKSGKEFIMRFFSESQIFAVFDSFLTKTPANFTIIALEDSLVTMISHTEMEALSRKHHTVEFFFRKLISDTSVRKTKRIHEILGEDSTWRYQNFMKENKHIVHRISLGDVSKFLGITQQSLSRIRSQK
ncbi:Crp/Fnr family transcriptional regulator [Mucilaginibacter sp.]|uniref:Crp/Fnr family transcriptional regulator n=1 Tax=Mucilaginibacter sp. TaxID=1882438 RepID=UPI00326548F2